MSRSILALTLFLCLGAASADDVEQARFTLHLEHWFSPRMDPNVDPDVYLEVWVDGERECHRSRPFGHLARNTRTAGFPICVRPAGDAARLNVQMYESGERYGAADRYVASRTVHLKKRDEAWALATAADDSGEDLASGSWVNLRDSGTDSRGRITIHWEIASVPERGRAAPGVYRLHLRQRLAEGTAAARLRVDFRGEFATVAGRGAGPEGWGPFSTLETERQLLVPGVEAWVGLLLGNEVLASRKVHFEDLGEDEAVELADPTGKVRGAFQVRFVPVPLAATLATDRVHRLVLSYRLWGTAGALERTSLAVWRGVSKVGASPRAVGLGHGDSKEWEVEVEASPFDRLQLVAMDAATEALVARRTLFLEELADGEYTLYGPKGESLGLVEVRVAESVEAHEARNRDAEFYWILVRALLDWERSNPATYDGLVESFEAADARDVEDDDLLEYRDSTLEVCRSFEKAGVAPRDSGVWKIAKGVTLLWKDPVLGVKSGMDYPKHQSLLALAAARYTYFPFHFAEAPAVSARSGGGTRFELEVHAPTPGKEDRCELAVRFDLLGPDGVVATWETEVAERVEVDSWTVPLRWDLPSVVPTGLQDHRLRVRVDDLASGRWRREVFELGGR